MSLTGKAGIVGQKPSAKIGKAPPMTPEIRRKKEKKKYEKMWGEHGDKYRAVCPGEIAATTFLQVANPKKGSTCIDFGCGTGNSIWMISLVHKVKMTLLDFASNCLDEEVKVALENHTDLLKFREHNLNDTPPLIAEYGYCTDVMEHIPPEEIDNVLHNILKGAQCVFFRISTQPDRLGPLCLNQPLHLSVHDYKWWRDKLKQHGCKIMHSEDLGGAVDFYVTNWEVELPEMEVNNSKDQRIKNIIENSKWDTRQILHCEPQDDPIMLLGGGPSLNEFEDEIIENHRNGMKVVTMNGSYNWCLERGIMNVNQCILDSRPFNKRFVEPPREDCYYFIASQADPSVFQDLPPDRTFMWHVSAEEETLETINEYYPRGHIICGGGSTVGTRAIVLMNLLGFPNQILYGFDGCLVDDEHHAYEQMENTNRDLVTMMIEGRTFRCQPWMALQAEDFAKLLEIIDERVSLTVKGDGLLAHILKTGARPPNMGETPKKEQD